MTPQLRRHFAPFLALKLVKNLRFLLPGAYQIHVQYFLGRSESFVNDISKGLYWLWVHQALFFFVWFPVIPPMPSLQQAEKSHPTPLRRTAPHDSHGKGSTTHPHPTPQPPHTPTTPTQQEREGKTDLSQIDQNYNTRENHLRTPQNHKRPLRREGRLWFSINAVYDFGPKTINSVLWKTMNAPFWERGVYGLPRTLFMVLGGFR